MVDLVQGTVRIKSSFSSDPIQVPGSNHQSLVSRRRSVGTPADNAHRPPRNVYNSLDLTLGSGQGPATGP